MSESATTAPVAPASAPEPSAARRACDGMPKVLLVLADVHAASVMKSSLDRHGFEVDTALSDEVGLSLYREFGHDAVVVDRGEDSAALVSRLREIAGPNPPFMLVVREAGADQASTPPGSERLDKPLSLRYLVARLTGEFGFFPI